MSREPFTMLPNRFIDSEMRGELSERQAKLCRYIARSASQVRSEAKLSLAQIVTGMRWEWSEDTLLRELKRLRPEWIDFESKPGQRGPYLIRLTGLAVKEKGADLPPVELGSEPPTSARPPHDLRKIRRRQPPHAEVGETTESACQSAEEPPQEPPHTPLDSPLTSYLYEGSEGKASSEESYDHLLGKTTAAATNFVQAVGEAAAAALERERAFLADCQELVDAGLARWVESDDDGSGRR